MKSADMGCFVIGIVANITSVSFLEGALVGATRNKTIWRWRVLIEHLATGGYPHPKRPWKMVKEIFFSEETLKSGAGTCE
jgi:hypothetical protein